MPRLGLLLLLEQRELHHAVVVIVTTRHRFLFLRNVRNHAVRGQEKTSNRTCILQSGTGNLRRIDYTGLDQVLMRIGRNVCLLYTSDAADE